MKQNLPNNQVYTKYIDKPNYKKGPKPAELLSVKLFQYFCTIEYVFDEKET